MFASILVLLFVGMFISLSISAYILDWFYDKKIADLTTNATNPNNPTF